MSPLGSVRVQVGVIEDDREFLRRLTAQVHPPRRTEFEDDDGGRVGPPMGLVVEDG